MPRQDHVVLTPVPAERDLGLVDALAQLAFVVHAALGRVAAEHDLSVTQARLLGILRDRRPTIKELAAYLQLDVSSVTGLVDRAERRGLVRRTPSPRDGRSVLVRVTPSGGRLIAEATAQLEGEVERLVGELHPEQRLQLSEAASAVVALDARRRGFDVGRTDV